MYPFSLLVCSKLGLQHGEQMGFLGWCCSCSVVLVPGIYAPVKMSRIMVDVLAGKWKQAVLAPEAEATTTQNKNG